MDDLKCVQVLKRKNHLRCVKARAVLEMKVSEGKASSLLRSSL